MKVLVIGRSGQLATELRRAVWPAGTVVACRGRGAVDLLDPASCAAAVDAEDPGLIVNAAAYTAVDRAESDAEAAFALNERAVAHLAASARRRGVPLLHVSTDYVFDGTGARPWREDDATNPLGVYGRSKLAGEEALAALQPHHAILRSSWVFAAHGQNFVRTMLRLAETRDILRIVDDQVGCPTAAADLARVVVAVGTTLAADPSCAGLYHYAGAGAVSWFAFARAIFAAAGDLAARAPALVPISTAEFAAPAPRPAYSVLDCRKLERRFGLEAAPWEAGLAAVLAELEEARSEVRISEGVGRA